MSAFRHNKKRNVGLVYEFLVRRLGAQMLEQDLTGYKKTFSIVEKYYSPGAPLAKELELFELIRNTRGVSPMVARKVLANAMAGYKRLNRKTGDIKKSNLIKEVNYTFGKEFFSEHRIPEYRLLASICMFLEDVDVPLSESVAKLQLEEALVKYMTTAAPVVQPQREQKEVDNLVCAVAAQKFQERYGKALNRDQKRLLEKFMIAEVSGDHEGLAQFVGSERIFLEQELHKLSTDKVLREDPVMRESFSVAIEKIRERPPVDETVLEDLMLFYRLVEEFKSNE